MREWTAGALKSAIVAIVRGIIGARRLWLQLPWWVHFTIDRAGVGFCLGTAVGASLFEAYSWGGTIGAAITPAAYWTLRWRRPVAFDRALTEEARLFPEGRDLADFCVFLAAVLILVRAVLL